MGLSDAVEGAFSQFTDDFTVYMFDRRKNLPETYSLPQMAEDTIAAFDALGIKNACIFGASQGGMIAMQIAAGRPDLVKKLVLGSTAAVVKGSRYTVFDNWVRIAESGNAEALYLDFGENIYSKNVFEQSRETLTEAAETVTKEELARFIVFAETMNGFDVLNDLKKIKCPVLVICDSCDSVFVLAAAEEIFENLGSKDISELYMYEGYGHAVYDTAPDFRDRMYEFFTAK